VDLPGLPQKGDVSDYLESHRARDLQAELREAPLYKASNLHADHYDSSSFNIELLHDLFEAPEEQQKWLVEDLLPAGGMSLLAGKPKAGKSTLARQLALSVATGKPFLQRETQQGAVIYLALEEKRQEVKDHFRALGATGGELIKIHYGSAPVAAMDEAKNLLQRHPASLLIIDPLFKFTRVKDANDYAQMTAALEPILALARKTGTHVVCVHHAGKAERSDTADSILGSTAILGNVDTALLLTRHEEYRTIASRQRYGQDLQETVLEFDTGHRAVTLGVPRQQAERDGLGLEILKYLRSHPGAIEAEILDSVVGRRQKKISVLRDLLGTTVRREGKGGKTDPYRYSCSPDSHGTQGTTTQNGPQAIESTGEILVPKQVGTSGNKNPAPNNSRNGHSRPSRLAHLLPKPNLSSSEFEEQVAILEVEGRLSRAEAARTVRESLRRERQ
jgi:hypothetical protein